MKKIYLFVLIVFCSFFVNCIFAEEISPNPQIMNIQIPSNTQIKITNINEINSGKVKIGDFINFKVIENLIIENQIVINADSPATGEITGIDTRQEFGGKIAILSFKIINVTINENQTIPVIGNFSVQGEKNKAFALPGGPLFAKIKNVIIPVGTEYIVLCAENTTVTIKQNHN